MKDTRENSESLEKRLAQVMENHPTLCADGLHVSRTGERSVSQRLEESRGELLASVSDVRRAIDWMAANVARATSNKVTIFSGRLKHVIERAGERHEYITKGSVVAAAIMSDYGFDVAGRLDINIWTSKESVAKADAVYAAFPQRKG